MNTMILVGLALVCLANIGCSAPTDDFGTILSYAEKLIEAENREVNEAELDHEVNEVELEAEKRDTEWHYYEAIATMRNALQSGDLTFSKGDSLLLNLDNKKGNDKWVEGCRKIYMSYFKCGQVPSNYFKSTAGSTKLYGKPKKTF
ncbi:unnamed protein product [Owenia fusiformis]|uniref:Uncharacterized protein n=1 Tax=Owenia fusiformis TaxID=6347 RepID=A0A8S4PX49_OWEFU|nr:unnamed protein product [Owenia fusiformis]